MAKNSATDTLLNFIEASPTPFHAVEEVKTFFPDSQLLSEGDNWILKANQNYLVTRGGSSILGFRTPKKKPNPDNVSFKIIGAHTDSPCLRLKPNAHVSKGNYVQWGCEVYGGALVNSWLDKDLHIAGRISYSENGKSHSALVNLKDVSIRAPQLAIHLDREIYEKGLKLNRQKHLIPILGLDDVDLWEHIFKDLEKSGQMKVSKKQKSSLQFQHDLSLYDSCAPAYGGLNHEFIYAARLDNLAMCHAAMEALKASKAEEETFQVFAFFDHEEVGSQSGQGAMSSFLKLSLERMAKSFSLDQSQFYAAASRSFVVSADMAHALHPNYSERHDEDHQPLMGKGPVIKYNANQRYMTNSVSAAYIVDLCDKKNIPSQSFVSRCDMSCGSTIGPYVASQLGMETIDIGNPMLSMHSIREMACSDDHPWIIDLFKSFYQVPWSS